MLYRYGIGTRWNGHERHDREATCPSLGLLVKRIGQPGQSTNERFRIVISDGINYQESMLAQQQNQLVHDGTLKVNSCVRLNRYICEVVQGKKIIIILDLSVEYPDVGQRIGSAVNIHALPGTEGFTPQQQMVAKMIGAATSDAGCGIGGLESSLKAHGMMLSDIRDACDYLSVEGHIYPTIDDDHFQLCTG